MATNSDAASNTVSSPSRSTFISLAAIMLATLITCLAWSHAKLFWGDELLEYFTDLKLAAAILHDQLRSPFNLDPPAYHLLLHGMHTLLPGHAELAARLPAMLALLVTEFAVFLLTWNLTRRASSSILAALLPFCLITINYGPEARVYTSLCACLALSLLSYRYATASSSSSRTRRVALIVLAPAIGLENLGHYYALFYALTVVAAEAYRTIQRRRFDWPILSAIAIGMLCFVADIPFMRAAHEFSQNLVRTYETHWGMIFITYLWFVMHFAVYYFDIYFHNAVRALYTSSMLALVLVLVVVIATIRRLGAGAQDDRSPVVFAILLGFLMPFWNIFIAHFITHAYQPRYSVPSCVAVALLVPFVLQKFMRLTPALTMLLAISGIADAVHSIQAAREHSATVLADTALTPQLAATLAAQPDHHLYIQNLARFLVSYNYATPQMQQTMVATYDHAKELQLRSRDTSSLTARNMQRTSSLPIELFEDVLAQPGPHLFAVYHEVAEEWIGLELASPRYHAKIIGHAFGADLVQVSLAPAPLSR